MNEQTGVKKALVLAGGLGTRLRHVLPDLPKPMAPIGGRPFLDYLILQLRSAGVCEIVLSVGYLSEKIEEYYGDGDRLKVRITYSREDQPLGTGGAILLARPHLERADFFVLNGDSFLDFSLEELAGVHLRRSALISMALTHVEDASRYGSVSLDEDGNITGFLEKGGERGPGYINGGVYAISPELFRRMPTDILPLSLEREVFPRIVGQGFVGHHALGFFRDIGVPADYEALCNDPSPLLRGH